METATGPKAYYYAWRGGPRLPDKPGTPEFIAAFNAAVATRVELPTGTVFGLIAAFKISSEFTSLAPRTQRDYLRQLKHIEINFGGMKIAALEDRRVRGVFKEWRDKLAQKSLRQADYAWTVLQRVFSVAKDRGQIGTNPCERGGRLYEADRNDKLWTDDHVQRFKDRAPAHLYPALMLALWTGQRQGDLLALRWSSYDGSFIRLRQSKGGRRVRIPVGAPLKAVLDALPRTADMILTTIDRDAWEPKGGGFRASWGKGCANAGIDDVTFHDFRGSAVTRLALAGATVPEIATITGHSLRDVEAILDAHYLGRDNRLAESGMRKLEKAAEGK